MYKSTCMLRMPAGGPRGRPAPRGLYDPVCQDTSFPASAVGAGRPRWIAVGGSGVDHLGQWDAARTTVTSPASVAADMMAEYVMAAAATFGSMPETKPTRACALAQGQ
jgi:hypothetical protein